jgi:dinuclear metal center YbgI/SA1388 family protein
MVKIKDITHYLEQFAPLSYQESYDNCGLLTGDENWEAKGALTTLDCTEQVIEEAVAHGCNLVIAHHPIWFRPIKKLNGSSYVERTIIKAIKQDVAIYAIHTNLDQVTTGVNSKLAEKIGLSGLEILLPRSSNLMKLVTFSPTAYTPKVLTALHQAGAGSIGNYQDCAFVTKGMGSFRPNEQADPHIGETGKLEQVEEDRIEVILPTHLKSKVVSALNQAHPYEEVAYYLQSLGNTNQQVGSGMIGWLESPQEPEQFLQHLKQQMGTPFIRHTELDHKPIHKVAICGGAGSFLIDQAVKNSCDAMVTADLKYHEFFDVDGRLLMVDIGHYESEVATKDLLYGIIKENFPTFAVRLSKTDTNPIRYF